MSTGTDRDKSDDASVDGNVDNDSVSNMDSKAEENTDSANGAPKGQEEIEDLRKKYLYLYADFENYKKRAIKERSDHLKFGHEGLIRELLQVVDNLERALTAIDVMKKDAQTKSDPLVEGIGMVDQQLQKALSKFGVTQIKSVGEKFDPAVHEAVAQEPATKEVTAGCVLKEHQKGFLLHGRLLRPSRVTVAI